MHEKHIPNWVNLTKHKEIPIKHPITIVNVCEQGVVATLVKKKKDTYLEDDPMLQKNP